MNQGDLGLLNDPIAQDLLRSVIPARLAYNWLDGAPRVVPIWFHWDGRLFVLASPPRAPKLRALQQNPKVALTIDDNAYPNKVLLVRGTASVEMVPGVPSEYAVAAERYYGEAQGKAWVAQLSSMVTEMGRIAVRPEWVGILDFEDALPQRPR